MSWLDHPGSLNWANRRKLNHQIEELNQMVSSAKDSLNDLLELVNDWGHDSKKLLELVNKNQLTANHILDLMPLKERIHHFQSGVNKLKESYQEELAKVNPYPKPET